MTQYTQRQLAEQIAEKLRRNFGRDAETASAAQVFQACALVLRDVMNAQRVETARRTPDKRQVHYLSMEFLMGRSLMKNACNLGLLDRLSGALEELGFSAADLFELEPDAGLGNGGLGRLAACYLEAMTTLEIPATGYSICYELGIFRQKIVDGAQVELADQWLDMGDIWLVTQPDETRTVRFGGQAITRRESGRTVVEHTGYTPVLAVPHDMVVAGFQTEHTNTLRLWQAKSAQPADMRHYAAGEYEKAVEQDTAAQVISKVLYPADDHREGKLLRLKQQYFFVSATAQDICKTHKAQYGTLKNLSEKHVIQINDTHPTLVIPELMRILLDEEGLDWEEAWHIVTNTVCYTNHTVLAEALECWPQELLQTLLPRIWMLVEEIAHRYQAELEREFPNDRQRVARMAILWDGQVRMANLCVCACRAINGVSALHTDILKQDVFRDAYARTPDKFRNVTNGIDHRRWLAQINPRLDNLIRQCVGEDYLLCPDALNRLERYRDDGAVLGELEKIKWENKCRFAHGVARETGLVLNTDGIFDVQVKRLHEYKRQLLNALHIAYLYRRLREEHSFQMTPRVFLFGGKAAPGYHVAKEIIRLINALAAAVNADPVCRDRLQVVFLENYRVSLAEKLIPASELSEQISTAGKEASGTGNMKFMMNGALTMGTLDGANVEICRQVGEENMFLFGLTAQQVVRKKAEGYDPREYYGRDPLLRGVLDELAVGFGFGDLADRLLTGDEYLLLADFDSYRQAQERAGQTYLDRKGWNQMALTNITRSGVFAADRAVREYAREIWCVDTRN